MSTIDVTRIIIRFDPDTIHPDFQLEQAADLWSQAATVIEEN